MLDERLLLDSGTRQLRQAGLHGRELVRQLSLLLPGDVVRHQALNGLLSPLPPLALDRLHALPQHTPRGFCGSGVRRQVGQQVDPHGVRLILTELLAVPQVDDRLLDGRPRQV